MALSLAALTAAREITLDQARSWILSVDRTVAALRCTVLDWTTDTTRIARRLTANCVQRVRPVATIRRRICCNSAGHRKRQHFGRSGFADNVPAFLRNPVKRPAKVAGE
jgi:hypothetical protein